MTILYLSQNGITDHIGQAQVAPYVLGLAARGYDMHLLSAEKPGREALAADYRARFAAAGVRWTTIRYHNRPPLVGSLWDVARMTRKALAIARRERIELVHSRSHPTMPIALAVKRATGARILFDFRDFWADGGIAKGGWLVPVYRWFKRRERAYVTAADHVNTLADRAGEHLRTVYPAQRASWSTIPCCADFAMFRPDPVGGAAVRARLGIAPGATVLLYLGSLGPDYLLADMMRLFGELRAIRHDAIFLFVVNNDGELARAAAASAAIPAEALRIVSAPRDEVPAHIAAADLSVMFIRADLSKLGCSPTKLGETLACGVPVIANARVGDLDRLLAPSLNGSVALDDFAPATMRSALERVLAQPRSADAIRAAAAPFRLEAGINALAAIYDSLGATRT